MKMVHFDQIRHPACGAAEKALRAHGCTTIDHYNVETTGPFIGSGNHANGTYVVCGTGRTGSLKATVRVECPDDGEWFIASEPVVTAATPATV